MEKGLKFLGICILISTFIISVTLFLKLGSDRYFFHEISDGGTITVFDKKTGDMYMTYSDKNKNQVTKKIVLTHDGHVEKTK